MSANAESGRLVALTGATGFIGGALAHGLLASGWRVRALVRNPARARTLSALGVQLVPGDLSDSDALQRLVADADAVVHCAGSVRGVSQADFDPVNATGVAHLVRAAAAQPRPPRFLALSSLAAREPQLSPYAASKHAGEQALAAAAGPMPWLALRPPAVYGPGDREMLPLLRWLQRGIAPVLGAPGARLSLLFVDDLVSALEQCLNAPELPQGIFELHDGHPQGYSWEEIVDQAAAFRGRPVRALRVPLPLLRGLARASLVWARLSGQPPMLSPGKYRELTHPDWVCDNRALTRASGWQPRVQFQEGLARTLAASAGSR